MGRMALNDQNRSRLMLRDNYVHLEDSGISIDVGTKTFTWTHMEAFQTVEIINSREWDGNLENFYRIGEWVAELSFELDEGVLHLLYMPWFTPPILPSDRSRLGFGVDFDRAVYFSEEGEFFEDRVARQFGFQYELSTAKFDLSAFAIRHIDRNFFLVGAPEYFEAAPGTFVPIGSSTVPMFFMTNKYGGSFVYSSSESLILKSELLYKDFLNDVPVLTAAGETVPIDYGLFSFGLEKSFGFLKDVDQLFLFEYQRTLSLSKEERLATEIFQHDVFFAWRFSFPGIHEKELQFGLFYDLDEGPQTLYVASYSQRWNENFKWSLGYRHFDAPTAGGVTNMRAYNKDHHAYFSLTANY